MKAKVIYRDASVRAGPSVTFESADSIPVGSIVEYSGVVQEQASLKEWIKLSSGKFAGRYINSLYTNSSGEPVPRVEFLDNTPPLPGESKINFAVVNFTDETGTHEVTLYPE